MEAGLDPEQALIKAVNRLGGQAATARLLEVAQPTIWGWLNRSDKKKLPAEHVLKVEAATGVSRHDLRPDIYPRGLEDDRPFPLAGADVAATDLFGADESDAVSQPYQWPIDGNDDGDRGGSTSALLHRPAA